MSTTTTRHRVPDDVKRRVGAWLKDARQRKGLSGSAAAERIGVERINLWKWENGQHAVPVDKLLALATLYKANLNHLKQ